jgi:hypothetical protein
MVLLTRNQKVFFRLVINNNIKHQKPKNDEQPNPTERPTNRKHVH